MRREWVAEHAAGDSSLQDVVERVVETTPGLGDDSASPESLAIADTSLCILSAILCNKEGFWIICRLQHEKIRKMNRRPETSVISPYHQDVYATGLFHTRPILRTQHSS
jgi:hypothetical protein